MIAASLVLEHLQGLILRTDLPGVRGLLEMFFQDLEQDKLYLVGAPHGPTSIFFMDDLMMSSFYFCADEYGQDWQPLEAKGSFAGELTWNEWALIWYQVNLSFSEQLLGAHLDANGVHAPAPNRVYMMLGSLEGEPVPMYFVPNDMTPLQGLAALRQALNHNWAANLPTFRRRSEMVN